MFPSGFHHLGFSAIYLGNNYCRTELLIAFPAEKSKDSALQPHHRTVNHSEPSELCQRVILNNVMEPVKFINLEISNEQTVHFIS